jgi:hypothetical protein
MLESLKRFVTYPIEIGKQAAKYDRVELGLSLEHQYNNYFGGFGDVSEAFIKGFAEGIPYAGVSVIVTKDPSITFAFLFGTPIVRGLTAVGSYGYYKIKGRGNDKALREYKKEWSLPTK